MTDIVLAEKKSHLQAALQSFASALSSLTNEQVPAALEIARDLGKLAEETEAALKTRALLYLNMHGHQVTDKGSVQAEVGGFRLTAIPTRTGYDPKKLEAVLRRRGLTPEAGMNVTVTYKVDEAKVAGLFAAGKLTEHDLEASKYDKSYRLAIEHG